MNPNFNSNLIFLTEDDLDTNIYRVLSYQRLIEIFQNNNNTLVKPKEWDDPFENFILNCTARLRDGLEFQIEFRDDFYGQCWSLVRESDAMWRIYSPEQNSVKIKTTICKLFAPLFDIGTDSLNQATSHNLSSFIGKVKYSSTKKLIEMLNDDQRMSNKIYDRTGWGQASTFFFKRWAFRHEKEVRIIYKKYGNSSNNIFQYQINPNEMIDEIIFDPRMALDTYRKNKSFLKNKGFDKKIAQSNLYKIRKFTIHLNPI